VGALFGVFRLMVLGLGFGGVVGRVGLRSFVRGCLVAANLSGLYVSNLF